ncbi:hypothetical protein BHM03_00033860 [Ensete ventricosum]|nr:hypothetical protein BHM03_00033860 [Ensete ventricosum]
MMKNSDGDKSSRTKSYTAPSTHAESLNFPSEPRISNSLVPDSIPADLLEVMHDRELPADDFSSQETPLVSEVEELKWKVSELSEEKSQLEARNQKLVEESAYAKGLASAAGVELKALSEEVTKLMNHNERLAAELASMKNSAQRRASNGPKNTRRDSHIKRHEPTVKKDVTASHERELQAALIEKEQREAELQKKVEESKQREAFLENELANMWILVAKLKNSQGIEPEVLDSNP